MGSSLSRNARSTPPRPRTGRGAPVASGTGHRRRPAARSYAGRCGARGTDSRRRRLPDDGRTPRSARAAKHRRPGAGPAFRYPDADEGPLDHAGRRRRAGDWHRCQQHGVHDRQRDPSAGSAIRRAGSNCGDRGPRRQEPVRWMRASRMPISRTGGRRFRPSRDLAP